MRTIAFITQKGGAGKTTLAASVAVAAAGAGEKVIAFDLDVQASLVRWGERRKDADAPGGVLVVEVGIGQAEPVAGLFAAAGLAPSPPRPDLNGTPRALVAWKRA